MSSFSNPSSQCTSENMLAMPFGVQGGFNHFMPPTPNCDPRLHTAIESLTIPRAFTLNNQRLDEIERGQGSQTTTTQSISEDGYPSTTMSTNRAPSPYRYSCNHRPSSELGWRDMDLSTQHSGMSGFSSYSDTGSALAPTSGLPLSPSHFSPTKSSWGHNGKPSTAAIPSEAVLLHTGTSFGKTLPQLNASEHFAVDPDLPGYDTQVQGQAKEREYLNTAIESRLGTNRLTISHMIGTGGMLHL
jgi:hypothetical protein